MKPKTSTWCGVTLTRASLGGVLALLALTAVWAAVVLAAPREERSPVDAIPTEAEAKPDGKELFAREWIPHDPRSPRGDGLGPVFNDSSCVACHNQGGAGGGGPASKNVHILTTTSLAQGQQLTDAVPAVLGPSGPQPTPPGQGAGGAQPQAVRSQSFVLHHFGTDAEFATWRAKMAQSAAAVGMGPFSGSMPAVIFSGVPSVPPPTAPTNGPPAAGSSGTGTPDAPRPEEGPSGAGAPDKRSPERRPDAAAGKRPPAAPSGPPAGGPGPAAITLEQAARSGELVVASGDMIQAILVGASSLSQRNATALFGAGKIDSIPERVLEEAAAKKFAEFPKVVGRVARDDKGRVGRFGWKAQKAGLEDFVLTACAVELGLDVPGHDQPPLPHKPDYKAPGLDLTRDECDALIKYVGELSPPAELKAEHPKHAEFIASGKALFASVGCATCHTPKLGDVDGIYSDLLLHDMGPGLTDAGSSYGIFQPNPQPSPQPKPDEIVRSSGRPLPSVVATAQEWRTPPLWGVRDSGPYLHDGRATTLEQAIALHGGQGEGSAKKFNGLSQAEKQKLLAFLRTLVAPEQLVAR